MKNFLALMLLLSSGLAFGHDRYRHRDWHGDWHGRERRHYQTVYYDRSYPNGYYYHRHWNCHGYWHGEPDYRPRDQFGVLIIIK